MYEDPETGSPSKHFYANGLHLAEKQEGTWTYYHQDHLGSTRLQTNSTGDMVYSSNYEPFGPEYGESGEETYRYTGKPEDNTGLYYYGARYYDPNTGRFITRDTVFGDLTRPQTLNKYIYCLNNPQKFTDPDGKAGMVAAWIVATAVYTIAHVRSAVINYEKNRNKLMTDSYHNWELKRIIVKETTRGVIKGGIITAGTIATVTYSVPSSATAIVATAIIADQISAPVSTAVACVYDKITEGPYSKETHAMELFESSFKPFFTAMDKTKEKRVDPILKLNPVTKLLVDEMYKGLKDKILYWSYNKYFDTSYDDLDKWRENQ